MSLSPSLIDDTVAALRFILPLHQPADVLMSSFFRDNAKLGAKDRAFIAETVFGILRRKRYLEFMAGKATPRHLLFAYLIKLAGMNQREAEPLLSPAEIDWFKQVKAMPSDKLALGVQADFPDWLVEKLQAFMPDGEILALARTMQHAAPLDLRVNTLLANRDEVLQTLNSEGIEAHATPYSPVGIRLKEKPALHKHPLFIGGKVEVQDEGSQLLAFLVAPKRTDMVADFCAGAGGKSLALGALMHSQGRLYAFDVSEKRLNKLKPRLKRSGLSNLHPQLINNENDARLKRLAGKIDRVLVDAPCSGLGTLRRNPDLKWRQTPQAIAELTQKQHAILASAAKLVKLGGRLVYATCSLLPEENEQIVSAFLQARPDFKLLDCSEILAAQRITIASGEYLRLSPGSHSTDGFFAAAMEKIS